MGGLGIAPRWCGLTGRAYALLVWLCAPSSGNRGSRRCRTPPCSHEHMGARTDLEDQLISSEIQRELIPDADTDLVCICLVVLPTHSSRLCNRFFHRPPRRFGRWSERTGLMSECSVRDLCLRDLPRSAVRDSDIVEKQTRRPTTMQDEQDEDDPSLPHGEGHPGG